MNERDEEKWPEFVQEGEVAARRAVAPAQRTGWETVVFELTDDQDGLSDSDFSTAAIAP